MASPGLRATGQAVGQVTLSMARSSLATTGADARMDQEEMCWWDMGVTVGR